MSIHAKLLAAQKAITAIGKTGHNSHFNYDFFEEREVLRVAREALNDAGLAFFYSVEDVSDRDVQTKAGRVEFLTDAFMLCTIYDAESGESLSGRAIGRGQDGQDKGINKAIVAGLKYWLLKTLMIPTDDDTERDENTNADGNASARPARQKPPSRTPHTQHAAADGDEMIPCPQCGSAMWDNRKDKKNPKGPDLKCKDKACGEAIWLDGWRDDLLEEVRAAHEAEAITMQDLSRAEDAVATLVPAKLKAVQTWLSELAEATR